MTPVKVYIVVGEPSGDLLAGGLMRALKRLTPSVEFRGVGGESMASAGLKSLFDISDISVMGIFEVLPRLPLILGHIRRTVDDIVDFAPDVLVTIDSWGFVSSVLSRLRRKGLREIPVVHYVAPQVWAWKEGRAKKVAKLVDRLMTLLPDEGRYFEKYGLRCDFVGHPVVERAAEADLDPEGFRAREAIPPAARVIAVLPGSRASEVTRLLPVLKDAVRRVVADGRVAKQEASVDCGRCDGFFVVVPTVAGVEEQVRAGFEDFEVPVRIVTGTENRYNAFAISEIALAKSGTVSLELTAFGMPHLIAYTFNKLSNLAARMLVKVRFANLINIIAGCEIIPEFVLDRCRPELIAGCAAELLSSPSTASDQVARAGEVLKKLRLPDILPSDRAAQVVLEAINEVNHNN